MLGDQVVEDDRHAHGVAQRLAAIEKDHERRWLAGVVLRGHIDGAIVRRTGIGLCRAAERVFRHRALGHTVVRLRIGSERVVLGVERERSGEEQQRKQNLFHRKPWM